MNQSLFIQIKLLIFLFTAVLLISCSTTRTHQLYGEDATIAPGMERISHSARDAAFAAETWVPLATALLIAVTNSDTKIQNWAAQNNYIFGSQDNAVKYSDYFLKASTVIYLGSAIVAPSGDDIPIWLLNKTKGVAVGASAILITQLSTSGLKTLTGRDRPDGSDTRSFPSGHTSAVAVNTILSSRNIEYLSLNPYLEGSLKIALNTLTLATGWARIEGNKHYPTDIFAGAALGNFVGSFINDAFLGRYSNNLISLPASVTQV